MTSPSASHDGPNSAPSPSRRAFLRNASLGCACAALPPPFAALAASETNTRQPANPFATPSATSAAAAHPRHALEAECEALLRLWCDALLRQQIHAPADPTSHGAFRCPACGGHLHGRAADSVYPLLCLAHRTGDTRYVAPALRAVEWMLRNVESPDGAWLNDPTPKAWKGITVFTTIALCEVLHHHGELVDAPTKARWRERLRRAGDFVAKNFNRTYGNINYPNAASYALALLGRELQEPSYLEKARAFGREALLSFTENKLIYGEGKPLDRITPKGCRPIDLAYNLEESLPSLAAYARLEKDKVVEDAVVEALAAHLEFMLPDGALDEGWCTRAAKWTYFGSRTSDGCAPGLLLLADRHPAFAAAAFRNLRLMRACTHDGLLHGGPHYHLHGAPPCVHHTFTHAKAVAAVLDNPPRWETLRPDAPLPRETAVGVRRFAEADAHLVALGPWRATIVGYDFVHGDVVHATGGVPSILHHASLGTLCASSMAHYAVPEPFNMQKPTADGNFPLTPRVELWQGDRWFTNLYDLEARIATETTDARVRVSVEARLQAVDALRMAASPSPKTGADALSPKSGADAAKAKSVAQSPAPAFRLTYEFTADTFSFSAEPLSSCEGPWSLVLPVVSPRTEEVAQLSDRRFSVSKPGGRLMVEADRPLTVKLAPPARVFNLVPGLQALPFAVQVEGRARVTLRLSSVQA